MTDQIKANLIAVTEKKNQVAAITKLKNQFESKFEIVGKKVCSKCGKSLHKTNFCNKCDKI